MSGATSRTKGHDHERAIATAYRAAWPHATVRRGEQTQLAWEPDVVVLGDPLLDRLWTECQLSRQPAPHAKLAQAERDILVLVNRKLCDVHHRLPLVVWRRHGHAPVHVTTRVWVLGELGLTGPPADASRPSWTWPGSQMVITLAFRDLLEATSSPLTPISTVATVG